MPGEWSVTGGVMEVGGELAFDIDSSPVKDRKQLVHLKNNNLVSKVRDEKSVNGTLTQTYLYRVHVPVLGNKYHIFLTFG